MCLLQTCHFGFIAGAMSPGVETFELLLVYNPPLRETRYLTASNEVTRPSNEDRLQQLLAEGCGELLCRVGSYLSRVERTFHFFPAEV